MRIIGLEIRNFKSIRHMVIPQMENALILVGQNNTGKTAVLDAIRAVGGIYKITQEDFRENFPNVEIGVSLEITDEDKKMFHKRGILSHYRRYDIWEEAFQRKLPSLKDGILSFTYIANYQGKFRYSDGYSKNNPWIEEILPQIYYIDVQRNLYEFQRKMMILQENELLKTLRDDSCIFERGKICNHCFSCIGLINQKMPKQLNVLETARLLDYKLYQLNLEDFAQKVNRLYRKNGGHDRIIYSMNRDVEQMLSVTAEIDFEDNREPRPVEKLGKGMRSIYMLSLLETFADQKQLPGIILVEEPEIFLHPKLQKVSGDVLYRLSRNNQVIFSTHSPNLLANFSSRQIRQIIRDENRDSRLRSPTDISAILADLGYTANDLLNVNFVFIVEGKQDKSRLPLLLRRYYSEIVDEKGKLFRVAIITTNSCTNIKTYANLKYMNQIYLRDQFLMIRDGDGQDPDLLKRQLCRYYEDRNREEADALPRVREKNVLILKYYSFENYFLNPAVMAKLGIVDSEESFYHILYSKWKEYLYKIRSGKMLKEKLGRDFKNPEDMKENMELIRIYLRGHNLYDIFYGRYKDREEELLTKYIQEAPREDFADILDTIDRFIYFEGRKIESGDDAIDFGS